MNQKRIYILFWVISLLPVSIWAQNDSVNLEAKALSVEVKDTVESLPINKKSKGNLFVSVDLFSPAMGFFSDKKAYQVGLTYKIHKKWNLAAEILFEKNQYDELDWKVDVEGVVYKIGFNWFITQDHENEANGFYSGLRFAYTSYDQSIHQYPIRKANNQISEYGSLPTEKVSAYWIEIVAGGRIQLFKKLYAEFSLRPEIYLGSKKQNGIKPLLIPGYGKDIGPINFTAFWGLSYQLF